MAESSGILNSIIGGVRNLRLSVIDTFGGLDTFVFEAPFMDDGLIVAEIDKLKAEYKQNAEELNNYERVGQGDDFRQEKNALYNRQMTIRAELAYLFSHNPAKIDDAIGLLEHSQNNFIVCLEAMKHYTQGNEDLAMEKFLDYMKRINGVPAHFLACKMLGTLLMNKGQLQYAIPVLRVAAERIPDDIEVHSLLAECYRTEGMDFELGIACSISKLLTNANLGNFTTDNDSAQLCMYATERG
jgi:predicted Zn-dependent protease